MERAIRHHLQRDIAERTRLTGGYTFETWLLTLSDHSKVVFRAQSDFTTGGGRKIVVAEVLEREKFFYDSVNRKIEHLCPEVYVVDGTLDHYGAAFQITKYIEGTPLHLCFDTFDVRTKHDILYRIGEMAARINGMEIDDQHPYVASRDSWEEYIAGRLRERVTPLVKNGIVTPEEIDALTCGLRGERALRTSSFLHLDMRRINMIYNDGKLFLLDAENCEFGDPLFELAVIDVGNELDPLLLEGYRNACGGDVDLDGDLYHYYKMERLALVVNLFTNIITNDTESSRFCLKRFMEVKNLLL